MNEYLYRYIGFDSFVGIMQKQALTFVLPEIWDDPKEDYVFQKMLNKQERVYAKILLIATHCKTYAQCWTQLAESDAMWRIYAYGNRALRIKIAAKNVEQLEGVKAIPIQYEDIEDVELGYGEEAFLSAITKKRKAFEHEKEIRLVNHYVFPDAEDFETHVKALIGLSDREDSIDVLEKMFPSMTIEEQIDEACRILNMGNAKQTTKDISFAHIPNFIEGVMVHPMAPNWFVDVVKEYCRINNVTFEGKSTLYLK